ncbi:MAG: FtsQ-type POTRA domain-containing protein [Acidimicrobiales bacterium]
MPALLTRGEPRQAADDGIDPRLRARRDEVSRDLGRRRRRRWKVLAGLVVLAVGAYGVSRTALLDVDQVVVQGVDPPSSDQVIEASGVRTGVPLLDVDGGEVATRVEQLPWVRSATVDRGWDGTVAIEVTERTAELQLADGQGGWLAVDGDGHVLGAGAQPAPALPQVQGVAPAAVGGTVDPKVRDAVAVARALTPALRTRVTSIALVPDGSIELGLRPSGRVRWGRADALAAKVEALQVLFGQVDLRDLCGIDVRVPQAPVLTRSQPCA